MIRSVVKHSYVKGAKGKAKARAHVNYIQYRGGEDREKGPRLFFDSERENVPSREVKAGIDRQSENGVQMHKLILSPGINGVDLTQYTREVMDELSRSKGVELDWKAVVHQNTDHHHVHVVLMGKDKDGGRVMIRSADHSRLREFGDRYLEREHQLDRFLDRERRDLLDERRAYDGINRLLFGPERDEREREKKSRSDDRFIQMDKELRLALRGLKEGGEIGRSVGFKEHVRRQHGRMLPEHGSYTRAQRRHDLKQQLADRPELAEDLEVELNYIAMLEREETTDRATNFDRLVGNDRLIERQQKQRRQRANREIHTAHESEKRQRDDDERDKPRDHQGNLQ